MVIISGFNKSEIVSDYITIVNNILKREYYTNPSIKVYNSGEINILNNNTVHDILHMNLVHIEEFKERMNDEVKLVKNDN